MLKLFLLYTFLYITGGFLAVTALCVLGWIREKELEEKPLQIVVVFLSWWLLIVIAGIAEIGHLAFRLSAKIKSKSKF